MQKSVIKNFCVYQSMYFAKSKINLLCEIWNVRSQLDVSYEVPQ